MTKRGHTVLAFFITFALLFASGADAHAVDKTDIEKQFLHWLSTDQWPKAAANGVSAENFKAAFAGVRINWDLPDLVPPGTKPQTPREQFQSEFRAPSRYFSEKTLGNVIAGGRNRLAVHNAQLARIEKQTGVPGRIVVAIWGRESGFGRAAIPNDAFTVLATKAFMATRKEMFQRELLAALIMLQRGTPRAWMKSSWAGALGQPQFLPTSYLEHATDGDGDGTVDIWNSEPDTLASIARYLSDNGWVAGRDWGFEVSVPASVSCALEGPDQGRKISEWQALGIKRINGRPFPSSELKQQGYLMMPAGRLGPAFVVTPNFYVLKTYNESDLYALFIGHAGDRMEYGGSPFKAGWQKTDTMLRSDIALLQRHLENLGHDVGGADGLPGFKTRRSIGKWQQAHGIAPTCFPSAELTARIK